MSTRKHKLAVVIEEVPANVMEESHGKRCASRCMGECTCGLSERQEAECPAPAPLTPYLAVAYCEGFAVAPDEETQIAAWQYLIDTGMCWTLQGWFGRMAADLIKCGVCHE